MQLNSLPIAGIGAASILPCSGYWSLSGVGQVVKEQLNRKHEGQILAVFERSFYIKTASAVFCIGLAEIGRGPLNALLDSGHERLPFDIYAGEHVRIEDQKIFLDDSRVIDAENADFYQREEPVTHVNAQVVQNNRSTLSALYGTPQDGFYWMLSNGSSLVPQSSLQHALRVSSAASLNSLQSWLQLGFSDTDDGLNSLFDISAATGLLGAGPGLTPAGDDVFAGVMLALIRLQRPDLVRLLWAAIELNLNTLTNPISAAHLQQAAQGSCGEAMYEMLNNLFQAEKIEVAVMVENLNRMGCTSGWDTLAGVAIVIDAWLNNIHTTHRTVTTC